MGVKNHGYSEFKSNPVQIKRPGFPANQHRPPPSHRAWTITKPVNPGKLIDELYALHGLTGTM